MKGSAATSVLSLVPSTSVGGLLCEFHQEEVVDLARQEMMESSGYVSRLLEGPDSSGSGGRPAISGGKSSEDVQVWWHGWVGVSEPA